MVVSTQIHWLSTTAGKPVTGATTSVYARKSTSSPKVASHALYDTRHAILCMPHYLESLKVLRTAYDIIILYTTLAAVHIPNIGPSVCILGYIIALAKDWATFNPWMQTSGSIFGIIDLASIHNIIYVCVQPS